MTSPEETALADTLRDLAGSPPFAIDAADVAAIERRGRRRWQRALALRGLAGVAVIALATAGAVGAVAAHGRTGTGGAGTPGTTRMAGYVRQQIETAPSPANSLLEVRQTDSGAADPSGVDTIWTDPATGNIMLLDGSGQAKLAYWQHDYYKNKVLNEDGTQVNYGPRTWWTDDVLVGGPVKGPVPSGPAETGYFTPAEVKAYLARPGWKITGYPTVDGHSTVEISFSKDGLTDDIWADARTYEVVRTLRKFPRLGTITQNYYWVPRSAAMTTLVNHPKVPAGFKEVPADLRRSGDLRHRVRHRRLDLGR
jgi:hypothetical protein